MTIVEATAAIAGDRVRGAGELLAALCDLLERARRDAPAELPAIDAAIRAGQPVMVSLHRACAAALDDVQSPGALTRFTERARRQPAALARVAAGALRHDSLRRPLRLVTWSGSSSVARAIEAVARHEPVHVTAGEGRPALEGRQLAARLGAAGIAVDVLDDGAVTTALPGASAVVVGADAVSPEGWINKAGTLGLAAAARVLGVPVLVLATRDKLCERLPERPGPGSLFEVVPVELMDELITDRGVLTIEDVIGLGG